MSATKALERSGRRERPPRRGFWNNPINVHGCTAEEEGPIGIRDIRIDHLEKQSCSKPWRQRATPSRPPTNDTPQGRLILGRQGPPSPDTFCATTLVMPPITPQIQMKFRMPEGDPKSHPVTQNPQEMH